MSAGYSISCLNGKSSVLPPPLPPLLSLSLPRVRNDRSSCGDSTKAVFVDTDQVPALDSRVGDLVQNETEAGLVQQLATALVGSGVKQEDIAIITPYRQQIKLLASRIRHSMAGIEILTADKSQGRDKDCIIISLVRSNDTGSVSFPFYYIHVPHL